MLPPPGFDDFRYRSFEQYGIAGALRSMPRRREVEIDTADFVG